MDPEAQRKVERIIRKLEGINIDDDGDLTIRIYTKKNVGSSTFEAASNGQPIEGRILSTMKVTRQVIIDSFVYFANMFKSHWAEHSQNVVDIQWDHPLAADLWFRVYHGHPLPNAMFEMPVEEVWNVIQFGGFLQATPEADDTDFSKLTDWFEKVLDKYNPEDMEEEDMRMFMFPCYAFDNAEGFATITRRLAYERASHITERNPSMYGHLHITHHIIGAINAARGTLRSKLLRGIFEPVSKFLKSVCECKMASLFSYCLAISKTGIWPLHEQHRKSINDIIHSPGFINFECTVPEDACESCTHNLSSYQIDTLRSDIADNFDGLCLDCINMTKTGDIDEDYWRHDDKRQWDAGCRINHDQPTWYFSFMGRRSIMRKYMDNKKRQTRILERIPCLTV